MNRKRYRSDFVPLGSKDNMNNWSEIYNNKHLIRYVYWYDKFNVKYDNVFSTCDQFLWIIKRCNKKWLATLFLKHYEKGFNSSKKDIKICKEYFDVIRMKDEDLERLSEFGKGGMSIYKKSLIDKI
jgi:hypothetical protein